MPSENMPDSRANFKANEEVTIEEARVGIGELVARASYGRERIVITRYGKPAAAIVGLQDLAKLEEVA